MKFKFLFLSVYFGALGVTPLHAQESHPSEPVEVLPVTGPKPIHPEKAVPVTDAIQTGIITTDALPQPQQASTSLKSPMHDDQYAGIVRVESSKRTRDYKTPWQPGKFSEGSGTAFMVGDGLFMTNAHVVADTERIYISKYADSRKIPARVLHVAHDADLALIEIDDKGLFKDVKPLEFSSELPKLEESVRVIGYPIGGSRLSVTRGIVSRIETNIYAHTQNKSHLTVQVDAAINPGNSGGPAFKGEKVVGVAFQGLQSANSTGYIIPAPVIERFLKDVKDGYYDEYVELGAEFFALDNPSMRKHFNLPDDGQGVLVSDIISLGSCDGVLEIGDVVLSVNGLPVDNSAMINLDGERVDLSELAERSFKGDQVDFMIIRGGETMQKQATLKASPNNGVTGKSFEKEPRFVTFAGFLFQPLEFNEAMAHQIKNTTIMVELVDFLNRASEDKKDIVMLTKTMPDEINARITDYGRRIVTKVDGVEVKGLSHLYELLYPNVSQKVAEYAVIELADAPRPIVISRKEVKEANARIATKYHVIKSEQLESKPSLAPQAVK